ncbi:MAG: hypothetical protein ACK4V4_01105 [Sphingobacteriales bacterium]|jgi:hypothetical protein
MKRFILLVVSVLLAQLSIAQQNKGLCKMAVNDVSNVSSFGYLVSYTVQFKNTSNKSVDGIYWTAYYYNNNGDLIKSEESSFNSTSLIDPVGSGETKIIVRAPNIKGASRAIIKIKKVHFVDGTKCE